MEQTKENINRIFAQAGIDVWRERADSGECTLYEAEVGIGKLRDSLKN